jgi:hypothetical protein
VPDPILSLLRTGGDPLAPFTSFFLTATFSLGVVPQPGVNITGACRHARCTLTTPASFQTRSNKFVCPACDCSPLLAGPIISPPGSATCVPVGGGVTAVTDASGTARWTCTTDANPPSVTFTLTVSAPGGACRWLGCAQCSRFPATHHQRLHAAQTCACRSRMVSATAEIMVARTHAVVAPIVVCLPQLRPP